MPNPPWVLGATITLRSSGVEGRAWHLEEQREPVPVLEHVAHGLAEARVGLHLVLVELRLQVLLEAVHHRAAVVLVEVQAVGGRQRLLLGPRLEPEDLAKLFEHDAALTGKGVDDVDELAASVGMPR